VHTKASELALGISIQGAFGDSRHNCCFGISIGRPGNSVSSIIVGIFISGGVQLWGNDINVAIINDVGHEGTSITKSIRSRVGCGNHDLQTLGAGSSEGGSKDTGQSRVSLFNVIADTMITGVSNLATVDGVSDTLDA